MTTLAGAARKLRARYAEGLPAKWRVVEEALAQLRAGDGDAEDTLRRVAHQLRGSAASFGFVAIDKTSFRVEHAEDRVALERGAEALLLALRSAYEGESTPIARVLLIDDDPDIGLIVTALLSEDKLGVTQVTTAAEGIEQLRTTSWDIIFVDLVLPDADGRTLLTQLRALPQHRDTPVVVLSAKTGSLVKNECSVYGVDDFIEKPIDVATFPVRVAAMLERTRAQQAVQTTDSLTGLPNRLGFRRALARLSPDLRPLTLAVVDLEHFAAYEHRLGQARAEEAISLVASLLRLNLRDGDVLGRWGGEEFLVAFPKLTPLEGIAQLRAAVEALHERELGHELGVRLSFCVGITEIGVDEPLDYALLRADQLVAQAKRGPDTWYATRLAKRDGDEARPRILIAEDDAAVASLLLQDLGDEYELVLVSDGELALARAEAEDFDLVLLDYRMPKLDGVEVVKRLRQLPSYAEAPILLLTAVGSDAAVESAFEAGADDYISKPHRKRALRARIARHLDRGPAPTLTTPPHPEAHETLVTALFCDISGFSRLTSNMSPREVLNLLNRFFPVVSKIVHDHGGVLEKYIGDAVLAVWGVPVARPDDVDQAAAAAVAIQEAVEAIADIVSPPLRVHIGLNSGLALATHFGTGFGTDAGSGKQGQAATVGVTTTVASRICDLAGPTEILLSDSCAKALGGRVRWPLVGPRKAHIKGSDEAVEVYELRWKPA